MADLLGALGTGIGGILNYIGAKDAQSNAKDIATQNINTQYDFAQNGIKWKVNDATQAGINPLYAIGASTANFSPVSVGSSNTLAPLGEMAKDLGQDLSRSVDATRTGAERVAARVGTAQQIESNKLDLDWKKLRVEEMQMRVAKLKSAQIGPPMPSSLDTQSGMPSRPGTAGDAEEEPPGPEHTGLKMRNIWETNPRWSDSQKIEDRYGDIGEALYSPFIIGADAWYNWNKWAKLQSARREGTLKRYSGSRFVPKRYRD